MFDFLIIKKKKTTSSTPTSALSPFGPLSLHESKLELKKMGAQAHQPCFCPWLFVNLLFI
jgi:hypothetical protein